MNPETGEVHQMEIDERDFASIEKLLEAILKTLHQTNKHLEAIEKAIYLTQPQE